MQPAIRLFAVTAAIVLGAVHAPSHAATATTTFNVRVTITAACDISTTAPTDVNFGSQPSTATNVDNQGALNVNCTPSAPYTIALDNGQNGTDANSRKMSNGLALVPYQLYRNATRTAADIWGSTTGAGGQRLRGHRERQRAEHPRLRPRAEHQLHRRQLHRRHHRHDHALTVCPWPLRVAKAAAMAIAAIVTPVASGSGLQVTPIGLRLAAKTSAEALWLTNTGNDPIQAQVRVFRWTQVNGEDVLAPSRGLVAGGKPLQRRWVLASGWPAAAGSPLKRLPTMLASIRPAVAGSPTGSAPTSLSRRGDE